MPKLYWESIEKGEQVTPITKAAVTRVQIARFAGASQDWSPLHLDDEFAKGAGYGGVFAHGAIALAFATEAVGRWMENGRILGIDRRHTDFHERLEAIASGERANEFFVKQLLARNAAERKSLDAARLRLRGLQHSYVSAKPADSGSFFARG